MSKNPAKIKPDPVKERFGLLQPTVYAVLCDFVRWNDICRYPDLPVDLPGPSKREKFQRNQINEFQIRHLAYSKEVALILDLWILLYEARRQNPNLLKLGEQCVLRKPSPEISDCLEFLSRDEFSSRFIRHRHNFIAHLASIQATRQDLVEQQQIYFLVPKTIDLVELLHGQLFDYPTYFDNQFTVFSEEVAGYFHHSKPDDLLADLFSKRALPATAFDFEADTFIKNLHQREKEAR
jgi:hypothetical protein